MVRISLPALVLGIALLGTGCSTMVFDDKPLNQPGVYFQTRVRVAYDIVGWDPGLSSVQRTVPVHPNDGGPANGAVTLDIGGSTSGPRLGLLAAIGPNFLRLVFGGEVRINPMADDEEFGVGQHDHEMQPLPFLHESRGYALFDPNQYTLTPFIGVESIIFKQFILGLEYGAPHTEFTWEKGHERFDEFQIIEKDVWDGRGHSGRIRFGYIFSEDLGYVGIEYAREHYDAEFSGIDTDVDANVFSIVFEARF